MIGVIGCGNMAQAIVKGFHQANPNVQFLTYTPSQTRAKELAKAVSGRAVNGLEEMQAVETILLACKPQQLHDFSMHANKVGLNLSNKYIISILAATPLEVIQNKLLAKSISRVMPNTPSLIGKGVSLILHSKEVQERQKKLCNDFFVACGETFDIDDEENFDKVTTVTGSGPAYIFLFAQMMAKKLESWGIDAEIAKKMVDQLFSGSSSLMQNQSDMDYSQLIASVTSKGGVTIEAINKFKSLELDKMTFTALDAAYTRSQEIKSELLG